MLKLEFCKLFGLRLGKSVVHKNIQHDKGKHKFFESLSIFYGQIGRESYTKSVHNPSLTHIVPDFNPCTQYLKLY